MGETKDRRKEMNWLSLDANPNEKEQVTMADYLSDDALQTIKSGNVAKTVKWDNGWTLELFTVNRGLGEDEDGHIITGQPIPDHYYGLFKKEDSPCVYLVEATDIGGFDSPKAGWIPHVITVCMDKKDGATFKEDRDYPFYKLHYSESRNKLYSILTGHKQ